MRQPSGGPVAISLAGRASCAMFSSSYAGKIGEYVQSGRCAVKACSDDFIVAYTPEEAVDRLAALYQEATAALGQALKRYLKERIRPDASEHCLFRYPELRLTYLCQGEVPTTVRAYAKVQVPGTYAITVTQPAAFRKYLLEQLRPLMNDFTLRVEVGRSQQNIPYPYVVEGGDELAGSGVT